MTTAENQPELPASRLRTPATLTIGELSRRTGVSASNLRMWESRFGFPEAMRLPSGHRRYPEEAVLAIRRVKHRRDAGVRLETAITEVQTSIAEPAPSVWAELRQRHPQLRPHRLRKTTLLALCWALEDECCARASGPYLFGAFQREEFYRRSERRWRDLSRSAAGAWVLADFAEPTTTADGPIQVVLPEDAPMRKEWSLVCLAQDFPAVLTAWELPGQQGVRDADRMFESVWTLEDQPTRDAARCLAHLCGRLGHDTSAVLHAADQTTVTGDNDLRHATELFNRVVAYVERLR